MSFTDQIGQLTGSATSNDTATIEQALENALIEFQHRIKQINPEMLRSMSFNTFVADNSHISVDVQDNDIIINVSRKFDGVDYSATRVDVKYQGRVQDPDSIYYADPLTPVYTFKGSQMFIYPEPDSTTGQEGNITRVHAGQITDGIENIAGTPSKFYPQIIRIAAYNVLLQRLGSLRDTMYTEYNDAIDKAKNLIDDATQLSTDTEDVEYWLKEEDPEMISSTLSTASQEIQRASAVANKFTADYQQMQNQMALIKQQIDETYQSYASAPVETDIGRMGVGT